MKSKMFTAALALCLAASACSSSSSSTAPRDPSGAPPVAAAAPQNDAEILAALSASDRGEIEQGQLAQSQASNADVRAFGQSMVTMHTESSTRMTAMAQQHGLTPAEGAASRMVAAEGAATRQRLAGLTGADFDRAYVEAQVTQHQHVLELIDAAMPNARNAELRTALQSAVRPMVAQHLQQARDLQSRVR